MIAMRNTEMTFIQKIFHLIMQISHYTLREQHIIQTWQCQQRDHTRKDQTKDDRPPESGIERILHH